MNSFQVQWCVKPKHFPHALLAGLIYGFIGGPAMLLAQVPTSLLPDATLPGGKTSLVTPSGPRFDIGGGHAVGPNLFHSFADFQVGVGDTANFLGQGASNILSRVTGSNPSHIFGTVGVDTHLPDAARSQANLFFLNPHGVVFGPHAALDLKGSFYVSTADDIRLGTGAGAGRFSATDPGSDLVTSAPPSAFGFLGETSPVLAAGSPAAISVQGLDTQGSSIVIVGRDAVAGPGGAGIPGVEVTGRLASQGGNVTLGSVHAAGSAALDALNLQTFSEGGRISLSHDGVVDVAHPTDPAVGGRIVIRGGQLTMLDLDTTLLASVANGPAPAIDVEVTNSLLIVSGGFITSTAGTSNGGSISLKGETVNMRGGGLTTSTAGTSNAGSISLTGETVTISNSWFASTSLGTGSSGEVRVMGKNLFLVGGFFSSTPSPPGQAGSGPTPFRNPGAAANVSVIGEIVILKDTSLTAGTLGPGPSGKVSVTGKVLDINGSNLSSSSGFDSGNAGSVTMMGDAVTVSFTSLSSTASGSGAAGNVSVTGKKMTLIDTNLSTTHEGTGAGGTITIEATGKPPLILIDTTINASVNNRPDGSDSTAGLANITVKGPTVNLTGGSIQTETIGTRPGGTITLNADHTLSLTQTQVSAQSTGVANAGGIGLTASDTIALDHSTLTTGATNASGGNIKLTAPNLIQLIDSTIESSVQGDMLSQGGNISLDPDFIVLQHSQILAKAVAGAGGEIELVGNVVMIDPFSTINASSQFGISGTVTIQSPIQNLSGSIAPLPGAIMEASALYSGRCAGQKGGAFSSFTVQGRDRIPLVPGELLPTPIFLAEGQDEPAPTSNLPVLPMAARLHLPGFEGRLVSQHLPDLFHGGCHS